MTGQSAKSGKHFYYQCQTKTKQGASACKCKNPVRDTVESHVDFIIKKYMLTDRNLRGVARLLNLKRRKNHSDDIQTRTRLVHRLGVVKREMERCADTMIASEPTKDLILLMNEKASKLQREREELHAGIEAIDDKPDFEPLPEKLIINYARQIKNFMKTNDFSRTKRFLSTFIKQIIYWEDKIELIYKLPLPDEVRFVGFSGTGQNRGGWDSNPRYRLHSTTP